MALNRKPLERRVAEQKLAAATTVSNPNKLSQSATTPQASNVSSEDQNNSQIQQAQAQIRPQPMYNNYSNPGMMGGMYGPQMGMYGGMNPMNPMMSPLNAMQTTVGTVGRISGLLQMVSQAVHMSFSSFVQMAGNMSLLQGELGGILSIYSIFRFFANILRRIKVFIMRMLGRPTSLEDAWENENGNNQISFINIGLCLFGILFICKKLYQLVTYRPPESTQATQNSANNVNANGQVLQQPGYGMNQMGYGMSPGMSPYGGMNQMGYGYGMNQMSPYGSSGYY